MESIDDIIGSDRALELTFDSRNRQLSAEDWSAYLHLRKFDEDYDELDGEVAASARLVRVNLDAPGWLDSLDAESADLEAVGAAFVDRIRIAEVDEDRVVGSSLTIIDDIAVELHHRGSQLSHALVRGIAHMFRDDIIKFGRRIYNWRRWVRFDSAPLAKAQVRREFEGLRGKSPIGRRKPPRNIHARSA